MANAVLLSKFSATKLFPQPNYAVQFHRLPNLVGFSLPPTSTPIRRRLDFSACSGGKEVIMTVLKMKMKMKKPKPKPSTTTRSIPRRDEDDIISWEKRASRVVVMMGALVLGVGIMSFPATAMGRSSASVLCNIIRKSQEEAAAATCSCLPKPSSTPEPTALDVLVGWLLIAGVVLSIVIKVRTLYDEARDEAREEARSKHPKDTTVSVLQLQVGLLDPARSLLRELTLLSQTPPTSTHTPQSRVFAGAVRALLCHPDYCISAYSCAHVETNTDKAVTRFRRLLCECDAQQEEPNPTSLRFHQHDNACVVMTILAVVRGTHTIPTIKASVDLKAALQKLESIIPPYKTTGFRAFWTPSDENKTLSEKELERYPLLKLKP